MGKFFKHVHLLPGRALIRRHGPGHTWGECLASPGSDIGGTVVGFSRAEFCFQKGKSYYVIALVRNCCPM
ncbi:MAG: hypothetical protein ACM3JB_22270 [Acidobacteriaceae bacterium]